ncbi:MAG: FkbM family methyltransferase [Deltaproteobacteria bacterium]|nr:FkbM family methyltransferase [Deltaproteobacteria bacterium]
MQLTSSDVEWAYRIILGRECESEKMIEEKLARLPDRRSLREDLLSSLEYRNSTRGFREFILTDECLVVKESNGFRIHLDLSEYISMEIANDNYDITETQFVKRVVRAGDTVLDLGAHVGYYTFLLASIVGEKGKVFSFEPQQHLFSLIQRSINENGYQDRIIAENVCVGDVAGEGKFAQSHCPGDYGCTHLLNLPSTLPFYGDMTIESTNVANLGGYNFPSTIDFIKIDIEGAEYLALKPIEKRLKKDKPIILSEVNQPLLAHVSQVSSAEYIKFVQDCGYNCFLLGDRDEKSIDDISVAVQNVIFVPKGRNPPGFGAEGVRRFTDESHRVDREVTK